MIGLLFYWLASSSAAPTPSMEVWEGSVVGRAYYPPARRCATAAIRTGVAVAIVSTCRSTPARYVLVVEMCEYLAAPEKGACWWTKTEVAVSAEDWCRVASGSRWTGSREARR